MEIMYLYTSDKKFESTKFVFDFDNSRGNGLTMTKYENSSKMLFIHQLNCK